MSNKSYRVVFLGASDVGKTSLITRMTENSYDSYCENTVACNFKKFRYNYKEAEINLSLWDTAGQELYRSIANFCLKGAKFFMLVCSIDNLNSLKELDYFIELINNNANASDFKIFILCNKVDIDKTQISLDDLNDYKEKINIDKYFLTSAKNGSGISDVLNEIAKLILQNDRLSHNNSVDLEAQTEIKKCRC